MEVRSTEVGPLRVAHATRARGYTLWAVAIVLAWTLLLALLLGAGYVATHSSAIAAFDRDVTSTVVAHRSPQLNALMKAVTWLGSWVAVVVATGILSILTARRRLPILGLVFAFVAWGGEQLGVTLAKQLIHRQRPPKDLWIVTAHGWSWPSGHAGAATLVFGSLALTVCYLTASRPTRAAACAIAAGATATVGFSRIVLAVHWTTDVLASIVFVSLWLAIISAVAVRHLPPRPSGTQSPMEHRDSVDEETDVGSA